MKMILVDPKLVLTFFGSIFLILIMLRTSENIFFGAR